MAAHEADPGKHLSPEEGAAKMLLSLNIYPYLVPPLACLAIAILVNGLDPSAHLTPWFVGCVLVATFQVWLVASQRRTGVRRSLTRFSLLFTLSALATAAVWMSVGFLIDASANLELRYVILLLLTGSSAVLVVMNFFILRAAIGCQIVLFLESTVWSIAGGAQDLAPRLVISGALCLFMGVVAWRLHCLLIQRVRLEDEKDRLVEELSRSLESVRASAEARARYLAYSSHDLRQPLYAATLHVEGLARTARASQAADLDGLSASLDALSTMFDELLDLSRADDGRYSAQAVPMRIDHVISALVDQNKGAAEKAGVTLHWTAKPWAIESDPALLSRLLNNLMGNAIRYAPNGHVTISVEARTDGTHVAVSDDGMGIDPSDHARIFDEFTRISDPLDRQPGLGLGLAIVRRLATILGADVSVKSNLGEGSRFTVGPFTQVDPARVVRHAPEMASTHRRIAVLENDVAAARETSALLTDWGYSVTVAHHPDKLAPDSEFDLLVTDHDLGADETGLDVISRIRKATKCPAILMTERRREDMVQRAKDLGVSILNKPLVPVQFRSVLLKSFGDDSSGSN